MDAPFWSLCNKDYSVGVHIGAPNLWKPQISFHTGLACMLWAGATQQNSWEVTPNLLSGGYKNWTDPLGRLYDKSLHCVALYVVAPSFSHLSNVFGG